jgi:uncharacterized membrane protein
MTTINSIIPSFLGKHMCRARILWGLFFGVVFLGLLYVCQIATGQVQSSILNLSGATLTAKLILALATTLLVLHTIWTLGLRQGTLFLSLGFCVGLGAEILGIRFGTIFGGHYLYNPAIHPAVMGVPLVIPVIWAGFLYIGHCVVSSCQACVKRTKARQEEEQLSDVVVSALGALAVVAIDLVMEPLQVDAGNWRWLEGGRYFHVPSGNFSGWFLVSFICLLTFQSLRRLVPRQEERMPEDTHLIPVMGYGLLGIVLVVWALIKSPAWLAVIGVTAMAPGFIINLYLFSRWENSVVYNLN